MSQDNISKRHWILGIGYGMLVHDYSILKRPRCVKGLGILIEGLSTIHHPASGPSMRLSKKAACVLMLISAAVFLQCTLAIPEGDIDLERITLPD